MTSPRPSTALGRSITTIMADIPFELVIMFLSPFTDWDYSNYPDPTDNANLSDLSNLSKVCKEWRVHLRPFLYTTYVDPVTLDDSKAKGLTLDRRRRFTRTILANPDLAALITVFKLDGRNAFSRMSVRGNLNRPIPAFPSDSLLKLLSNVRVLHLPMDPLRYGSGDPPLILNIIRNPLAFVGTFPHLKRLVLCCSALEDMGHLYVDTIDNLFEHPTLNDVEIRGSVIRPLLLPFLPRRRAISRLCLRECSTGAIALIDILDSCSGLQTFEFVQSEDRVLDGLYPTVPTDGVRKLFNALSWHGSTLEVLKLDWRELSPNTAFAKPQLCESLVKLRCLVIPEVVLMGDLEHSQIAVKEGLELYFVIEHTHETIGELLETIPLMSRGETSVATSSVVTQPTTPRLAEILPVSLVSLHIIHCFPGIHQALSSLNTSKRLQNLKHVSVELLGAGRQPG